MATTIDKVAEDLVMLSITRRNTSVFLRPEHKVMRPGDTTDVRRHDFLAIDLAKKTVSAVEVSTAANVGKLLQKVRERHVWSYPIIRQQLDLPGDWEFRTELYVRANLEADVKTTFRDQGDVQVYALPEVGLIWPPPEETDST